MELERYKHQHKRVAIFKPMIDDRYSANDVVSHMGWRVPAYSVKEGPDILGFLAGAEDPPQAIAVDEAFMINDIADVLIWLYRNGFDIIVSTLDLSAAGKPFHEVEKMMAWATKIEKCTAICTVCGMDAFYTHKKQLGGEEIEVGGVELYEPRCHTHHLAINQRPKIHDD